MAGFRNGISIRLQLFVDFEPLDFSTPVSAASLYVAKGNNEQAASCAQYVGTRNTVFYSNTFVSVANTSLNTPQPTIAEGEAAHEIGHSLGFNEANSNPATPTVMNQPSGSDPVSLCSNPTGAPTRAPTYKDATTVNTCITQARSTVAQGSYGGINVYSTITYYPDYGCTYIFNEINWLLDDSYSGDGYPFASASCQ